MTLAWSATGMRPPEIWSEPAIRGCFNGPSAVMRARIDPASEEVVFSFLQGGHNGGDIHFGPDGMLYISTGDAASPNPPDPFNTGQDISDLLSSILRIDRLIAVLSAGAR